VCLRAQATTFVVLVPRSEVAGAFLQLRVMEERVVKGKDGKRGSVTRCQATVALRLPWALHCSEPPTDALGKGAAAPRLAAEDVCACWYPLTNVGGGVASSGGKGTKSPHVRPLLARAFLIGPPPLVVLRVADWAPATCRAAGAQVLLAVSLAEASNGGGEEEAFDRDALARNVGSRGAGGSHRPPPSPGGGSESGDESGDEEDEEVTNEYD
jgi:hypothetical protein